jgi:hypothetical protein
MTRPSLHLQDPGVANVPRAVNSECLLRPVDPLTPPVPCRQKRTCLMGLNGPGLMYWYIYIYIYIYIEIDVDIDIDIDIHIYICKQLYPIIGFLGDLTTTYED